LTNPHKPAARTSEGGLYAFYAGAGGDFFSLSKSFRTRIGVGFS
jgi:hypothetical protein